MEGGEAGNGYREYRMGRKKDGRKRLRRGLEEGGKRVEREEEDERLGEGEGKTLGRGWGVNGKRMGSEREEDGKRMGRAWEEDGKRT
jgi:hypothetical protein